MRWRKFEWCSGLPSGLVKRGESASAPFRPVSLMFFEIRKVSSGSSGRILTPASVLLVVTETVLVNGLKSLIYKGLKPFVGLLYLFIGVAGFLLFLWIVNLLGDGGSDPYK